MKDLRELMNHIASVWICDEERYPALQGMSSDQRKNFLIKHSLLHISKTSGKIATVCESFDHSGVMLEDDEASLRIDVVKMFVNVIKLAEEVGLTAEDLQDKAPTIIR